MAKLVRVFNGFKLFIVRSSYPHNNTSVFVNLSSHTLTPSEIKILELGHSFVNKPASFNSEKTKRQLSRIVHHKPTILEILNDVKNSHVSSTLNEEEKFALENLRNNSNIVITQADKGDTWVVLDKVSYIFECDRQLNDSSVYLPLIEAKTALNCKLFRKVLTNMLRKKEISAAMFQKLIPKIENLEFRIFYTLPKLHKPPCSWPIKNKVPPGRPIIGNSFTEDTEICRFIDSFLQPIVSKQPHIVSNTDEVLHKISLLSLSKNAYLFSLDVTSLYTNIPIAAGINTVKEFFERFPETKRPDKNLLTLLSISLYKNDFFFNGQFYRQKKGVAMGKQFAPNFANLYMCRWEENVLHTLPGPKPKIWLRYIDDIFGIWEGSITELKTFVTLINECDSNIQVSCNSSLTDLQFLDLVIFKNTSMRLSTFVFLKPTSSLRLIHPRSLHPKHTKTGVIFSQISRFFKNCTYRCDFVYQLKFLTKALLAQGYSFSTLRKIKQKVFAHVNYQIGENDVLLKGFFPCQNNCKLCINHGLSKTSISFEGGARVVAQCLNCRSANVIYVVQCNFCSQKYVGETCNSVKLRITQHLSNIRTKRSTPVSDHFNQPDHSITDFRFFALVNNTNWSDSKRKAVENKWILKLGTRTPNGINKDLNHVTNIFITVPFKGRCSVPSTLSVFLNESNKTCFTSGAPLRVNFSHKHMIARDNMPQILH
jgi:hypothetical protein